MTNYITFFSVLALSGILYSIYYSNYVFVPKMKKLKMVQEFRYVSNLNSDLIAALKNYAAEFNAENQIFLHGLTFGSMISSLEKLREKSYTTDILKTLKSQETNKSILCNLLIDIRHQIEIHHEVKDSLSRIKRNTERSGLNYAAA
ncbi:hypothetical protein KXQ82_08960 [Mucilaginibacter sp. HMF5004]|uniref:hypothetical protein n=1 Tax=Mucilaginibacter rivuli TaxID=2857527 RepID=UPI001C5F43A5|nr:hypothetical protein [Mucilaginibacter rivuli]MBW4889844.1 hypothetical protein [Mucilaginibacter rivuli]